jgi:hypothetical protein
MPRLFLDIETAPDMPRDEFFKAQKDIESDTLTPKSPDRDRYWQYMRGGLTPFQGKVILITYQINDNYTHRLTEWDTSESKILKKFYDLIVDLQRGPSPDRLQIIGHNILGFDLFFLYNRMSHHKIADHNKWIYQWIINKPEVIDFLQLHLPLNDFNTKGLKHDVLAHAYGFPIKETQGSGEILHYYNQEYDEIINYSKREFIYPQLYNKIKSQGMVSKENLQKAIQWYNEKIEAENNDNNQTKQQ